MVASCFRFCELNEDTTQTAERELRAALALSPSTKEEAETLEEVPQTLENN